MRRLAKFCLVAALPLLAGATAAMAAPQATSPSLQQFKNLPAPKPKTLSPSQAAPPTKATPKTGFKLMSPQSAAAPKPTPAPPVVTKPVPPPVATKPTPKPPSPLKTSPAKPPPAKPTAARPATTKPTPSAQAKPPPAAKPVATAKPPVSPSAPVNAVARPPSAKPAAPKPTPARVAPPPPGPSTAPPGASATPIPPRGPLPLPPVGALSASPPPPAIAGALPPPLPNLGLLGWEFGTDTPREPFPDPAPGQALIEADTLDYRNRQDDIRAHGDARYNYRHLSLSAPLIYVHQRRETLFANTLTQSVGVNLFFRGHHLKTKRLFVDFLKRRMKARGGVLLVRRGPEQAGDFPLSAGKTLSPSQAAAPEDEGEEPLVRALKKRATSLSARNLDFGWAKDEGTLSASGRVRVEQPKWLLTCQRLRVDEGDQTTHAAGNVVLRLSDSRWLVEEDVLPATRLTQAIQDDPVTLTTPQLDYDRKNRIGYFHGPVVLKQPGKTMTGSSLTLFERDNRVVFRDFRFDQQNSRWLLEKGVVSSVPSRVERDMDQPLRATARRAVYHRELKRLEMKGRVRVRQGTQLLQADTLVYDEPRQWLELLGRAAVRDETTQEFMEGEHLVYNQTTGRFEATGAVRLKVKLEEENTPVLTPP